MITNDIKCKKKTKIFTLRIDENLFNTVQESAKLNKRSTAKEIEYLLSIYLKNQK